MNSIKSFLIIVYILSATTILSASQDTLLKNTESGFPLVYRGDTLLYIRADIGPFSPLQRSEEIIKKLDLIIENKLSPDSIKISNEGSFNNINLGSVIIMSVTDNDAILEGITREQLSKRSADIFKNEIKTTSKEYSLKNLLINYGVILLLLLIVILIIWLMKRYFPLLYKTIVALEKKIPHLKIKAFDIVDPQYLTLILLSIARLVRVATTLFLIYYFLTLSSELIPWAKNWNLVPVLRGILKIILLSVFLGTVIIAVNQLFNTILQKIEIWKKTIAKTFTIKQFQILSEERSAELFLTIIKTLKIFAIVVIIYFYLLLVFSVFEFTEGWTSVLMGYILAPLKSIYVNFISYIPNLAAIIIIILVTRYASKFIKFIFSEIEKGSVKFDNFPAEWANPTYKIVRFLVFVFAAIVIFPYLPGSSSPIFQGISVFLGVLFSLGSTSAISNIVAGTVLTYMRPFKIGDRVKIADTIGDIMEKSLLVTRIRTIKNEDITIPNSMILGSHIINFSSSSKNSGLILHTTVTIGYDTPWDQIHKLLISAAIGTEGINKDPLPFVLQTSLNDFYVSYEINAYTSNPNQMANIYSDLHKHIQDKFNEAGVEIMSPHYSSLRDGNSKAIPDDYLPKDYQSPSFNVSNTKAKDDKQES